MKPLPPRTNQVRVGSGLSVSKTRFNLLFPPIWLNRAPVRRV